MALRRVPIFLDDFGDGNQDLPVLSGNGSVSETGGALVVSCTAGQNMDWRNGKVPYVGVDPQEAFTRIYYEFTVRSWTPIGSTAQVWGILHQNDSNLYFIYSSDAVNFYAYKIIGGTWTLVGGPIATSLPRKFRMVWDRSLSTIGFQCQTGISPPVWTNIVADQAIQISPTKFGLTVRNWSPYPAATAQFEDVEVYADEFSETSANASGFEDDVNLLEQGDFALDHLTKGDLNSNDTGLTGGFEDQGGVVPAGGQQITPGAGSSAGLLVQEPEGLEDSVGLLSAGGAPDHVTGVPGGALVPGLLNGLEESSYIEALIPTYAKGINDADGRETIGYSSIRQVFLYDATQDPWHAHSSGHYGAGRDGVLYYDGVACGPGAFSVGGTPMLNDTAWAGPGTFVDRYPVAKATEISYPVAGTVRFTPSGTGAQGLAISSALRWFIIGDFDVQIDFNIVSAGSGPSDGGLELYAWMDTNNGFYVRRRWFGANVYDKDVKNNGSYVNYQSTPTTATSGKIRITRVGSLVSSYYWSGSAWTQIGTSYTMTYNRPVFIAVGYYVNNTPTGVVMEASNFMINSGVTTNIVGWAREAAGTYRGSQAAFPQRVLVASSGNGFDILDADTGKLWMSFRGGTNYFVGGDANYYIRQIAIKDGVLLVAYRTFDSFGTNDGWAAWIDFTLDCMRLHRGPGYNDAGLVYNVELTTGVFPRDSANGSISWRNSARGFYASHFDNWQFQSNRANWCDLLHDSGFQYRAVASNGGTYVAKWARWKFEGATNAHINTPDYGKSTKTTAMQWVLFDPSTKALYYHDRSKLYVVAFATWSAVLTGGAGGTWVESAEHSFAGTADTNSMVVEAQDKMILHDGYLWYARAQGVYRMDPGTGISTLFYGHSVSGALNAILPEYATVLSLQTSMDGPTPILVVSLHRLHDAQAWTQVALIDLVANTIHGLGPLTRARSGYALAV